MLGLLLTATTRVWQVKAAVEFLLSPVPFIPHKRVATMIGLLLRFIPLILSAAAETADAQRARGVENRRNPIFRMVKLAIPLLRKIFLDADRMATAMDARCFTELRSTPALRARSADWGFLAAACGLAALSFAFSCP
jgi:energy-coupling factor transporter transmembrane protein EcfT